MPGNIPNIYPAALESRLSKISYANGNSGRCELDFKELYFILQADEGKYAFQSHARQMERAGNQKSKASDSQTSGVGAQGSGVAIPDSSGGSPLECEELFPPSSLILESSDGTPSRIIAIANAGHGKTTLLNRIALFYCQRGRWNDLDEAVCEAYRLPKELPLIPCIIRLRSYSERLSKLSDDISLCKDFVDCAIRDSIIRELEIYEREHYVKSEGSLGAWLSSGDFRDRLLLLFDGLDELSHKGRLGFIAAAREYLTLFPKTRIILTSRVAGLSENGVMSGLSELKFRGRSIMPLTDRNARSYSELWIKKSCEPSVAEDMLRQLDKVMTQSRYRYMREMMHAPLDLMVMLISLSGGTMAPNRFRMFTDILRSRFTSHEAETNLREAVFTDTMLILGLAAYRMQKRNVLSVSEEEIGELTGLYEKYSYQSDIRGGGKYEDYIAFFDRLSANSGIIEKETRSTADGKTEVHYTFPIRSYHECLTAYAVCHLRFSDSMLQPNPAGILIKHVGNKSWNSIINFAIADLSGRDGESEDLRVLLEYIFTHSNDTEQLRGIIESDPEISDETAKLLFAKRFSGRSLEAWQKEIIFSCMQTMHYYSYEFALFSLYRCSEKDEFLSAYAYSASLSRLIHKKSLLTDIIKRLKSDTKNAMCAAAMVKELACLAIKRGTSDETAENRTGTHFCETAEICRAAREILVTEKELAELLYERAINEGKQIYFEAISNLFTANLDWSLLLEGYLTTDLLYGAVKLLCGMMPEIANLFRDLKENSAEAESLRRDELYEVTELLYAFGVLGTERDYTELCGALQSEERAIFIRSVTDTLCLCSFDGRHLDRMSLAYAKLLFGCSYGEFVEGISRDIYYCLIECGKYDGDDENEVQIIKTPGCNARERKFGELFKETLTPFVTEYAMAQSKFFGINTEVDAERALERYLFNSAYENYGQSEPDDFSEE